MLRIVSKSFEDTTKLGMLLARYLTTGDIICLTGDLGSGKTAFTQGIGLGLDITDYITSPTFTIINEYYTGRISLYHFDVYRLGSSDELLELGCDEYFFGDGVTVIEWADIVSDILPEEKLWITISAGQGEEERIISFEAYGNGYESVLKGMESLESTRY